MGIRAVVESRAFNLAAMSAIALTAVLLGVETYLEPGSGAARAVGLALWVCVVVFAAEVLMRFLARTSTRAFFADGWNIFDLVIIAAALVPAEAAGDLGPLAPALRILRVLRVLRLVRTVPELRLIVDVLWKSVLSMKWIGLLALLSFYMFAIIGCKLFGKYQPEWATMHESLFTLFRLITGDDWTQLRYEAYDKVESTRWFITVFYVVWVALGTFILINLVVGAIINNYQQVQEVEHNRKAAPDISDARLAALADELQAILKRRAEQGPDRG